MEMIPLARSLNTRSPKWRICKANRVYDILRFFPVFLCLQFLGGSCVLETATLLGEETTEKEAFFESKVRPLLSQHCVECHGTKEQSGELRLDSSIAITKGGSSGPIVIPGEPDKSQLVKAIRYADPNLEMPPKGKLSNSEIATLEEWVRSGAYWPKGKETDSAEPLPPAKRIEEIRESHWSYRPIESIDPPTVKDSNWPKQPIDNFILSALESKGIAPNKTADRRTLMLRAYFTLVGLAPSFDEVQAFVADDSPEAFSKLIDRLLESPHYGERWARHWLDVARFGHFDKPKDS